MERDAKLRISKSDVMYYVILAGMLVVLLFVRVNVMKIIVPSGSMLPTLELEDIIYCWKVDHPEKLDRGDIVIFYSEELDMMMVKRLIGKAGEVIDLRDGTVFVDGIPLEEDYVNFPDSDKNGTFEVPEGHLLFLGDNRNNSNDARYWEQPYIPYEDVKAVAGFRISPSSRIGFV